MANCRKCRTALPEGAKFCHICGIRQDQQKQRKTKTRGNGTGTVFKRPNGTYTAMKTLSWEIDEAGKNTGSRPPRAASRQKKKP